MSRSTSSAQVTAACDRITVLAGLMPAVEQSLRRRKTIPNGRDGMPSASGGDRAGKGGHSDRTGEDGTYRAEHPAMPDPVATAHAQVVSLVDQAVQLLENAASAAAELLPKPPVPDAPITWCRAHLRAHDHDGHPLYTPASRAGLCDWCYRNWHLVYGEEPPAELLELQHRQGRLWDRDMARYAPRRAELASCTARGTPIP